MTTQLAPAPAWYREPWPWLLMAGPAAVIVAGAFTIYLAVVSNDGLVADDYYKRGLAINQTLLRDAAAQQFGYRAHLELAADFGRVRVTLGSTTPGHDPLVLRLVHPGRPALDRRLPLTPQADRSYAAAFPALAPGRWRVILEDAAQRWRLVGDIAVPGATAAALVPVERGAP